MTRLDGAGTSPSRIRSPPLQQVTCRHEKTSLPILHPGLNYTPGHAQTLAPTRSSPHYPTHLQRNAVRDTHPSRDTLHRYLLQSTRPSSSERSDSRHSPRSYRDKGSYSDRLKFLMCSYTRDPHIAAKPRPLPSPGEATRQGSYTDKLAVDSPILQLHSQLEWKH
jgi:hypothetical protein